MKNFKKVIMMCTAIVLAAMSLAGCDKQNEPTSDLTNWLNATYVADAYNDELSSTFSEEDFNECKKKIKETFDGEMAKGDIENIRQTITGFGIDKSDKRIDDLINKMKDGSVTPVLKSFKNVKFTVEETSNDGKKAAIKVKSVPIDMNATMDAAVKLAEEKSPKDFDPASITAENVLETFEKVAITPMCEACAESFAAPKLAKETETVINMEFDKEAKIWKPADADMEKLQSVFMVGDLS